MNVKGEGWTVTLGCLGLWANLGFIVSAMGNYRFLGICVLQRITTTALWRVTYRKLEICHRGSLERCFFPYQSGDKPSTLGPELSESSLKPSLLFLLDAPDLEVGALWKGLCLPPLSKHAVFRID